MGLLPIIQADAQRIPLASGSVQCVVTSPPYFGLRFYPECQTVFADGWSGQLGREETLDAYVGHLVEVFREVRRVLMRDGTLWVVIADGFAGSGKGWTRHAPRKNGDKQNTNVGSITAGPPVDWKRLGLKDKDKLCIPWRLGLGLQADGWWLRSDVIWEKPNPFTDSTTDRPTPAHEYVLLLSKSKRYAYDNTAVMEPLASDTRRRLSQPDLDLQMGGYKAEAYVEDFPGKRSRDRRPADILRSMRDNKQRAKNLRTIWRIVPRPYPGSHFATFTPELVSRIVRLSTKEGDVVLDPFCGSGTTVEVAYELRRVGIGLDLVWDYCRNHAVKRFRKGQAKGRQEVLAL